MALTQYSQGQNVTLIANLDGAMTQVTGEIMKVAYFGNNQQHLTIYGNTPNGDGVRVITYNDDTNLTVTPTVLPVPNPYGEDEHALSEHIKDAA